MIDDRKEPTPADSSPSDSPASPPAPTDATASLAAPSDITAAPPLLDPPPPAATPPLVPPVIATDKVPLRLKLSLGFAGLFLLFLCLVNFTYAGRFGAHQIGALIGAFAFWPAVIVGIFSIWPRFRTGSHRATIILWVWGLLILSQLGLLTVHRRTETKAQLAKAESAALADNDDAAESAAPTPARDSSKSAARTLPDIDYDFSPGSAERLIKLIESAQEDRYQSIVAAYARACALRPEDSALALERIQFIERFAHSEDNTIASAGADLQEASRYLKTRFPHAPGTVLHKLERLFGPAFEADATRHAPSVAQWPAAERARFFLLRAQRTEDEDDEENFARRSFEAEPSVAAALLLLSRIPTAPPSDEARRVLAHEVFRTARQWEKKQHMDHLFKAGIHDRALAVYEELKVEAPVMVRNSEMAMRLADAGHVPAARALLGALPTNQWNRAHQQRERFRFELKHGTAEEAATAYRTLRAQGLSADPFLRERVRLALKHPFAGWAWPDAIGLALLVVALLALLASPLLLVMPIHYWSLLRQRRAGFHALPPTRWGLRDFSLALGLLIAAEILTLWALQPEVLHAWWNDTRVRVTDESPDRTLLLHQSITWAIAIVVLGFAVWRAGAWSVFKRNTWTWGRTISRCFAAALVLRILLLSLLVLWPDIPTDVAKISSETHRLCLALLNATGPLGMIAAIAVVVPFVEEILFRGVMLEAFAKHIPFGWANTLQAVLFALVHENYQLFPFYVAFGVFCGLLARHSGSLLGSIAVHAINNLTVALGILALNR